MTAVLHVVFKSIINDIIKGTVVDEPTATATQSQHKTYRVSVTLLQPRNTIYLDTKQRISCPFNVRFMSVERHSGIQERTGMLSNLHSICER